MRKEKKIWQPQCKQSIGTKTADFCQHTNSKQTDEPAQAFS